ncbi:MAG: 4Fe-4S dicluster domain-containing protein [Oscillospiraceae bacterium]|nr:4Fe-4S dicluster domain-containing protein [Oscillospiraceae bacterium]
MYKMNMQDMPEMLTHMAELMDVYVPVRRGGLVNFEPFSQGVEVDLGTLKTVKSPKDFFLPQVEHLFSAQSQGSKLSVKPQDLPSSPFAIFGIRSCDSRGLEILDSVYLSEPVDKFYEARREKGIIMSLACLDPTATCFCTAFEIDPAEPKADVAMWEVVGQLYAQAQSAKGESLIIELSKFFQKADIGDIAQEQGAIREKASELPWGKLPLQELKSDRLLELFDAPQWEELHKTCLACGICTYLCPTCQCYDVQDHGTGAEILRYRCWDSCMYSDFTMMAHGNIRNSQKERFRQRFMHKLVYHPENNGGEISCVGCGRCVSKCPASLNIIKVINSLVVKADV